MRKASTRGIYRRQGAEEWSFDFVCRGHRFCGSTGCTSRREAEKWIAAFRAKKQAELDQLDGKAPMTFGMAQTRWWEEKGKWRKDAPTLEGSLAWLQRNIGLNTALASIDDNTVARLVSLRRADGVSPSTVNRSMTEPLRAIITRAALWGQPVKAIKWGEHKLQEPVGIVREATAEDEATAFASLRADLRPAARFLLVVGWRCAEACRLRWADVDLEAGFASVVVKGGAVLRRPLPAAALAILSAERGKHPEFVFTYQAKRADKARGIARGDVLPIPPVSLSTAWVRMRDKAGLKGLRLHDLRHTTATRILRKTGNLMAASKALGHARVATTQRYAHVLAEDLRAALDAAAPASPVEIHAEPVPKLRKA